MDIKKFTGLRNDTSAERFAPGDLVSAVNVDIDSDNRLTRRAGLTLKTAGAFQSIYSTGETCYLTGGSTLHQVKTDYTLRTIKTGLAALPMAFCQANDQVYFSNGIDTGIIRDGQCRSWGMPQAVQPTTTAIPGALDAGTYQYLVTYLRSDGQESGAGLARRIEVGASGGFQVDAVPAPSDSDIAGLVLYVSESNGAVLYEYGSMLFGETFDVISRGPTSRPLQTQFMSQPPAGQALCLHRGHLLVGAGDLICPSEPYAYEHFDLRRYFQMDGRITLLASMDEMGLIVGTDKQTAWITGDTPDEYRISARLDYGVVAGTLAYVDGTLLADGQAGARSLPMWFSTRGICAATPDGQLLNLSEKRYQLEESGTGAAIWMPDVSRYLAVLTH